MNKLIPIEKIIVNALQPEIAYPSEVIDAASDKLLCVIEEENDQFQIVAHQDRYYHALAQQATNMIVNVLNFHTDDDLWYLDISELTPIEEGILYLTFISKSGYTQKELAESLNKSQSTIANKIRLLNLPQSIQDALSLNIITERHARALLKLNSEKQLKAYQKIVKEKLTVKQAEDYIQSLAQESKHKANVKRGFTRDIQVALNTIDRCVTMIEQLGIHIEKDIDETDDIVTVKLNVYR